MVFASIVCEFEPNASVTVWDQRILRTDTKNHQLALKSEHVEYWVTDMRKTLKQKQVKVFFRWEVMSTVGFYYADKVEIGQFTVPDRYLTTQRRPYAPGPSNRKENY